MVAGTRYQDDWVLDLYRAAQAAIGQELKIECEPPGELTPELTIILRNFQKDLASSRLSRLGLTPDVLILFLLSGGRNGIN